MRKGGPGHGRMDAPYGELSTRPLHALVFLLPLIVLYEIGSVFALGRADGSAPAAGETIRAHRMIESLFRAVGAGNIHLPEISVLLPGILAIAVLLIWHLLRRDPWKIRLSVLGWMGAEAVAWTLPLLVLAGMAGRALALAATGAGEAGGAGVGAADGLAAMSFPARATIAIGAGVYEELLFRMVGIALAHFIAADLIGMGEKKAAAVAVLLSAIAFGFYHDVYTESGALQWGLLLYYVAAGLYFGGIFVWRGFGIVVATHAIFDLIVLGLRPPSG